MGYKTAYKEVMFEYEKERDAAKRLYESRYVEVCARVPRVREITELLRRSGAGLAQRLLMEGKNAPELIETHKTQSARLRAERAALIKSAGFPADYLTDIHKCAVCGDTGYIRGADAPDTKCACLRQRMISKYYGLSNLGSVLEYENFDFFDLRYYSQTVNEWAGLSPYDNIKMIYMTCMEFINSFDRDFANLLFYGDTGLGKTFLMNCVAKEILDMGKTVLYVTAPQLFKVLEDYRFNRDELDEPDEYISAVNECDLLMIDDLGTEISTVVTSSELFNIINRRLIDKKHTVISTNLTPNDYENQYSERVISRFFGSYKMLKFIGDDIRMLKKYKAVGSGKPK